MCLSLCTLCSRTHKYLLSYGLDSNALYVLGYKRYCIEELVTGLVFSKPDC